MTGTNVHVNRTRARAEVQGSQYRLLYTRGDHSTTFQRKHYDTFVITTQAGMQTRKERGCRQQRSGVRGQPHLSSAGLNGGLLIVI